ncbi:MAG: [FeFe] hydrogenase H-cluster radical SAM maturase HydE [Eubacterium sp.]|jgi:biotin synthase|nr:[FeFe] hydrogenase H-cluster radical SAM maturase HydE [Eubacterium sp.]
MRELVDRLEQKRLLSENEFLKLLENKETEYLFSRACAVRERYYGKAVYLRGLIEFTNYCKNNCYYCGIRRDNKNAVRYRLERAQILDVCRSGYEIGFRTFVLQGGEDPYFTDDKICEILADIKSEISDCAITLSIGEKKYQSYQKFRTSGADRYLLRYETASPAHYAKLHPQEMSFDRRISCLYKLNQAGLQVGTGFMVGSPFQDLTSIVNDLKKLNDFKPQMVGIGPFIPHKDTPFASFASGSPELTLVLIAVIRLMFPAALLPSTTALGTLGSEYRVKGLLAGANVLMPNLTPPCNRENYKIYDNKAYEPLEELAKQVESAGYYIDINNIGDSKIV